MNHRGAGIDIELSSYVVQRRHQLVRRAEAIDVSERRIRIEVVALDGGAENALDGVSNSP